ncbi:hypothetical protein G7Y89_g2282 [Cudoniella acicularis]|uniref:Heterokaryon incompatibility domain-containing protein n=1 Tax=Cudoniella acicularis TaxID=354080 RepID=A0A8H4W6N0_9HELO|nr:hypothetical protein G7Y89_g2282 [Cudoniella acicularis]
MTEKSTEWRALVIDKVNEEELMRGASRRDVAAHGLPTQTVRLPAEDNSQVSVLSWRWDGEHRAYGSQNVLCAVRIAKQMGIHYLFIDVVSIDQNLSGEEFLRQVMEFSTLYSTIQVIAAYDIAEVRFRNTINRPWIVSKVRLFRCNPNRIVYVGHSDEGGSEDIDGVFDVDCYFFNIWTRGFTFTILGILCNQISMHSIADLKFVIALLSKHILIAYDRMS